MGEVLTTTVLLVGTSLLCLLNRYAYLLILKEQASKKYLEDQASQQIAPILDTMRREEDW
jgi:hypothetical protein